MALNKAQTSLLAKIVIGVFGVILVIGLAGPSISALLASLGGGDSTTGTGDEGPVEAIAAQHQPVVDSWESVLASDPTSSSAMVGLGNTYFDWAADLQQSEQVAPGLDRPYWNFAALYYDQAIGQGVDDPGVHVDAAIAEYYSGDAQSAADRAERAIEIAPDFAPAYFNGGIFYADLGRTQEALAAFGRYLEIDPDGQFGDPQYAQEQIAQLQQATPAPSEATTP
jgi:tetratricopeptide (TPR) repeat protein